MSADRPRILLTLPLPDPAPRMLSAVGELVVLNEIPSTEDLAAALADDVDVACVQLRDAITPPVLAGARRLKALCNYAVGYDNVDVAAASARGIYVTNTPDVLTTATADCALGLMLAAARRLCEGDHVMRAGGYEGWRPDFMLGLDLNGATLAIIGLGRIGRAVAERARAFEMNVIYVDAAYPTAPQGLEAKPVDLDTALRVADVVSLHAPLTETTHHLINEEALMAMKPTAVLVNSARGPLVDEAALVRALDHGWIAGAGLDVYEREPRMAEGLARCRNAVLAPHLGSATHKTRRAMAELCARNAIAAARGDVPPNALNADKVGA